MRVGVKKGLEQVGSKNGVDSANFALPLENFSPRGWEKERRWRRHQRHCARGRRLAIA